MIEHSREFSMSLETTAKKFVDLCNQGKNFDVMRSMYASNIVSVEADGSQWSGRDSVIQKSVDWNATTTINSEKAEGPYHNGPDQFAVHFTFEVTRNDSGKRETLDEIAVYTVKDDQITREEFFYEGEH
jgi:hypothetical protein